MEDLPFWLFHWSVFNNNYGFFTVKNIIIIRSPFRKRGDGGGGPHGEKGTLCEDSLGTQTLSSCQLSLSYSPFGEATFKLGNRCFHSAPHIVLPERHPAHG